MNKFKLSCVEWNGRHVKFNVFDPYGANCGQLTLLATDIVVFIQQVWKGSVFWNGLMPTAFLDSFPAFQPL